MPMCIVLLQVERVRSLFHETFSFSLFAHLLLIAAFRLLLTICRKFYFLNIIPGARKRAQQLDRPPQARILAKVCGNWPRLTD